MISVDLAKRAYDHSFRIDPIIRSLLDTDFYKLLMLQMILKKHPVTPVTFSLINRTTSIRIAEEIDEKHLREQLDHARTLQLTMQETTYLRGNTFFGRLAMFTPETIEWLKAFRLPEYDLKREDGQYVLTFSGPWAEVSLWEVPALAIINELRARTALKTMSRFELDILYSRGKAKLWSKVERLRRLAAKGPLALGDFGTRRRHGFLWQKWCCEALMEGIGPSFSGTSNVRLAMELGLEAIGTNAHELPMVYAALAGKDGKALRQSRYTVLEDWAEIYAPGLKILLPDAYGSTSFLKEAPAWVAGWSGARPDSKDPIIAGDELIEWWTKTGENPKEKLIVLSDGMDIDSIEHTATYFRDRVRVAYGWGTNFTNDFAGCAATDHPGLKSISLVCKVSEAGGRPTVKLSDNPLKRSGPNAEIERYLKVFGEAGMAPLSVKV